MGAEAQNEGYFAKFPLLRIQIYLTNLWSDKLLWLPNCNWQKPDAGNFRWFQAFSWSKTTLCILRNKYGFQKGNAWKKLKSFSPDKKCFKMAELNAYMFLDMKLDLVAQVIKLYSDHFEMDYMYALSWKLLIIGLLLEYFATLLKYLHLMTIAKKHSIFLH